MNYYFFPIISGFDSSITLVNFPSLETQKKLEKPQLIYATWSDGKKWHYRNIGKIASNQALEIKHSDLPKDIPSSPFLFFHPNILHDSSDELFLSDHMYVMPTWRGNIKVLSEYTSTSYQGDYQHEMVANIRKGSLVSISPMIQTHPNISNHFILVNINKSPVKNRHDLYFFDARNKRIIHKTEVFNNTCNIVDLSKVEIPEETLILAISKTIAGIPIYFSHTQDRKHLSFEHTHPPASLVVFGDPLYFQTKLKTYWLQEFEKSI